MPELPEVETISRQLRQVIIDKKVKQIKIYRTKNWQGQARNIIGQTVDQVKRRAKIIIIHFKPKFPALIIHLKMTGQLIYQEPNNERIVGGHPTLDWISKLPSKHTRVQIIFANQSQLFFNDQRTFGWLKVITNKAQLDDELVNFNKIEPLKKSFTPTYLGSILAKSRRPVKIAIMDQKHLAGVGNIYANDALFLARINPVLPANQLKSAQVKKLHQAINKVIGKGVKYGGASESTYRQLDGLSGSYQNHFLTYKKDGQPCPQCGRKLVKIKLGGRGTFYCSHCQK